MEKLFSIGTVSELLGISKQTLHYYDKIGLVKPCSIDSATGYRYYEYDQFHYIDRIKYLQSFGLSLKEIEEALEDGAVDKLLISLKKQEQDLEEEARQLEKKKSNLSWYIRYYEYLQDNSYPDVPFKRHMPPRYALAVPCYPHEPIRASGPIRLTKVRSSGVFNEDDFLRQNGYLLDYGALMDGRIQPTGYYIYLSEKPAFECPFVREFPAGEYLCFRGRILANDWNAEYIQKILDDSPQPELVIADEYEDNLKKFTQCVYEIQFLLHKEQER